MKKQLIWTLRHNSLGDRVLSPDMHEVDLQDPFYSALFEWFFPYAHLHEIEGTALAAAVKSGHQETVTNQPDLGCGAVSATATPLGDGRYLVEYEVKDERL